MRNPSHICAHRPGFALPMTVIAVAGLTLLLVGLLTILTLERKTARSYSDAARAEFAVESGLAIALGSLSEIAKRDDSIVFRLDHPMERTVTSTDSPPVEREQYFTYGSIFEGGVWKTTPLFSGVQPRESGAKLIDTQTLRVDLIGLTGSEENTKIVRPTKHDSSIPQGGWVDLPPDGTRSYRMRFAYWVEDLSGRVDGNYVDDQPRVKALSPAEIRLSTFIEGKPERDSVIAARGKIFGNGSARTILGTSETGKEAAKLIESSYYFSPAAPPEIPRPRLIPHGFGYASAGLPTKNLNGFVESGGDPQGLADYIGNQITTFGNRRGNFGSPNQYLLTIAANIIDYADEDSTPTIINIPGDTRPVRGVDAYPFVNLIYDRYRRTDNGGANIPVRSISVEVRTFVELWNPTNKQITGKVKLNNIDNVGVTFAGPRFFGTREMTTFNDAEITIEPNQHKVVELFIDNFPLLRTYTTPFQAVPPFIFISSSSNRFELFWNGQIVDGTLSSPGMTRAGGGPQLREKARESDTYVAGNIPPLIFPPQSVGDPRVTYYIQKTFSAAAYDSNSSWGGRNALQSAGVEVPLDPKNSPNAWPDGGFDYAKGVTPGSRAWIPGSEGLELWSNPNQKKPYPDNAADQKYAPTRISNIGRYDSLIELGNIFDPAQVANIRSRSPGAATVTVPGNGDAGGGFSLALGRAEFPAFDQEGHRAAQLLDLFHVDLPNSNPAPLPARKININTAGSEVLRALLDQQPLTADADQGILYAPLPTDLRLRFASQVVGTRNASPLRSFSDLALINPPPVTDDPKKVQLSKRPDQIRENNPLELPFFGNDRLYSGSGGPKSSWSDAGREEALGRLLNLVKFNSKLFRIVVVGEALDATNPDVLLGRSRREYHYSIEPARDSDGKVDATRPVTLLKLYEKSL